MEHWASGGGVWGLGSIILAIQEPRIAIQTRSSFPYWALRYLGHSVRWEGR